MWEQKLQITGQRQGGLPVLTALDVLTVWFIRRSAAVAWDNKFAGRSLRGQINCIYHSYLNLGTTTLHSVLHWFEITLIWQMYPSVQESSLPIRANSKEYSKRRNKTARNKNLAFSKLASLGSYINAIYCEIRLPRILIRFLICLKQTTRTQKCGLSIESFAVQYCVLHH